MCGVFTLSGFVYDGINTIWKVKKLLDEWRKRKELQEVSHKMEDDKVHDEPSDLEAVPYNPNELVTGTS